MCIINKIVFISQDHGCIIRLPLNAVNICLVNYYPVATYSTHLSDRCKACTIHSCVTLLNTFLVKFLSHDIETIKCGSTSLLSSSNKSQPSQE